MRIDHVLKKPKHLVEHEEHRRQYQRSEQRNRDGASQVTVDQG
jgi:hypothetical protein